LTVLRSSWPIEASPTVNTAYRPDDLRMLPACVIPRTRSARNVWGVHSSPCAYRPYDRRRNGARHGAWPSARDRCWPPAGRFCWPPPSAHFAAVQGARAGASVVGRP
jgi:hypothetical protein